MDLAVSIRDVASRAGVSFTTVSKVLNERPGDRTALETRRRIKQAAEELGYRPNAVAQSLRSRRTDIIGFYTGLMCVDMNDPFQAAVLNGLQEGCQQHNKDLLIHRRFFGHSPEDVYKDLSNHKVDGIVLPASCDDVIVQRLTAASFPAVGIATPDAGLPSVYVDSPDGFRRLAAHLAGLGHRRILYRTQRHDLLTDIDDTRRRRQAFESAGAEFGMEMLVSEASWEGALTDQEIALLLGPKANRPTAVACWNDRYAYQTLAFCRQVTACQVPGDLAVTGFDGFPPPYAEPAVPSDDGACALAGSLCLQAAVGLVVAMTKGGTRSERNRASGGPLSPATRPD